MESIKNKSRRDWTNEDSSLETLRTGCLMRIADATEKMAKRHTELIDERDRQQRLADYWRQCCERTERRLRAAKGQITKLRKRLAQAGAAKDADHA